MRRSTSFIGWGLAAAGGTLLLIWAYPRAAPFQPRHWRISASQAEAIAFDHLRQFGQAVPRPYVVTRLLGTSLLERRLQLALAHEDLAQLRATGLPALVTVWEVTVYPPEALRNEHTQT